MSELVTATDPNMNVSPSGDPVVSPVNPVSPMRSSINTTPVSMKMERKGSMRFFLPMVVVAIVAGVGTGYVLSTKMTLNAMKSPTGSSAQQSAGSGSAAATVQVGKIYGSTDASTFKDSAEGVLVAGGINGEGSEHIVREGGASQNVYLTSSVLDLSQFEGDKVTVKGQTYQAQKAGWLMDVGQVSVEQLNAPLPDWAQKAAASASPQSKQGSGDF
jgi:hypothetical protein